MDCDMSAAAREALAEFPPVRPNQAAGRSVAQKPINIKVPLGMLGAPGP